MGSLRHFGNEFLHHHVDHRACRKGQKPRHHAGDRSRRQHAQYARDGLDNTAERPVNKTARVAQALFFQRQRDRRAFGKVLQRHAQRKRQRAGEGHGAAVAGQPECQAHGKSFRHVVQRDGQHQHGRAGKRAFQPLRLIAAGMQVRAQTVQRQQKHGAQHKAARRGKPGGRAGLFGHFHSGNQQRPH